MGAIFNTVTYILFITTILLQFLSCCSPEFAGGVETTNGMTIAVKQNQIRGTALAGSQIVLCDTSYVSYKSFEPFVELLIDTTIADEYGKFNFDSLPDGCYNLAARNFNADSGTLISKVQINRSELKEIQKSSRYAALGSISGTAFIDSQSTGLVLIYVVGTDLRDTSDSKGVYTVKKVPSGTYRIVGTYIKNLRPGQFEYYSTLIENVTVPENGQTNGVELHLEQIN